MNAAFSVVKGFDTSWQTLVYQEKLFCQFVFFLSKKVYKAHWS